MFRTIRRASVLVILSLGVYALGSGCGGDHAAAPGNRQSGLGSITVALLSGGVTVNAVAYAITGPNGFSQSGSINVSTSSTISALIGGLPAGMGYVISLTATAADGTTSCAGSANFGVTANTVTQVAVGLDCHQPAKTGSISINGTINVCPSLQGISALPAALAVGGTTALTATATDVDSGPGPLVYSWTASTGPLTGANTATPTFMCTTPGSATLTVTASDGDATAGCAATGTVQITCTGHADAALLFPTATKIKHLVVVFGENISYDHYFGTYPNAPGFAPASGTPANNNLTTPLDPTHGFAPITGIDLLNHNPVAANSANGAGAANPFLLFGASQAFTADQGHNYKPEQQADDNGAMDLFPEFTGTAGPPPSSAPAPASTKGLVMAHYDAQTVSALWGWAQQYAMSDNSWSTVFGPSTPGAINLIAGQTNGFATFNKDPSTMSASHVVADGAGDWTLIGDTDPVGDVCSTAGDQNSFKGRNIGDLLNAQHISWGWFEGGFDLTVTNPNGTTGCARQTNPTVPFTSASADYIPHHAPFQYYASTANLTHARPSSLAAIGSSVETDGTTPEPANHQYDSNDFFASLAAGNLPAVTYVKAPAFQDGHPGYSDPVDEQSFLMQVVTAVQGSQEWSSTAIILAYDDSDGWYDHQMPPIVNPSASAADALNGTGLCNTGAQQSGAAPTTPLLGANGVPVQGRCGYGTRMPLLVISPYARHNYIDHTLTDQSSILKFVEDNWLGGQRIQAGGSFDTIAGSIQNMFSF